MLGKKACKNWYAYTIFKLILFSNFCKSGYCFLYDLVRDFQVLEIREKEIAVLREIALHNAAISLTWSCAPFLVAIVTFGLYVKIDPQQNQLTPQVR